MATASEKYEAWLEQAAKVLSAEFLESLKSIVSDLNDEAFERGVDAHNL